MKVTIPSICGLLALVTTLCGCGQSKPEPAAADQRAGTPPVVQPAAATPAPATPAPATPAATPPPATPVAATPPPAQIQNIPTPPPVPIPASDSSGATAAALQLASTAKTTGDTVLSSVSTDLITKVKTLVQSATGNDALKSQLASSLKSLTGGNEATGLTSLYQTAQLSGLTPSQIGLAKEVGNLASAYVVQKNFASLDGAQSDVGTIVTSLRQGQFAPAIPAMQRVAQNASLTPTQKQLVASIADQYAPGISKAAGVLGEGLQKIPGLGGK